MKPATNRLAGRSVHLQGRAHLLQPALVQDRDAVAHGHGLHLVVGDVHRGGPQLVLELLDLGPHLHPEPGVQVRERLVEQEHRRVADDGPPQGHPLALPARKLPGLALEHGAEAQDPRGLGHPPPPFGLRGPADPQAELQVLADRQVRVQRIVLEDHGHVPGLGGKVVDGCAADGDGPGAEGLEAGDHPQHGGLSAPRRSHQDHELVVADLQVKPIDDGGPGIPFGDMGQGQAGHARSGRVGERWIGMGGWGVGPPAGRGAR